MLGAGNDRVEPKGCDDVIDGGDGLDTMVLHGERVAYPSHCIAAGGR